MSSPELEQDFPGHLLHQAALWDNEELLLDLLNGELISHINSQDSWGRTPLHAAATTENSKCLGILLKAGATPNKISGPQDNFKTPLHTSSEHGFLSNVQQLVEAGADPLALEGHGCTSIDLAERGGHVRTHEFLQKAANSKEEARESAAMALREIACSGDVNGVKNFFRDIGRTEVQSIINLTPNGNNTLLFKACEAGNKALVELLLENGSDGRIHPVTKYSPLYISSYFGHKEIVSLLLKKFPLLVQVPTVEKWLPIHACCINGHVSVMDMLLKFEYQSDHLQTFRYGLGGEMEYEMAFDINFRDVSGQTPLYIACQMGNQRLVDALLKYRVQVRKLGEKSSVQEEAKTPTTMPSSESEMNLAAVASSDSTKSTSPTKRKVSEGIQGILNKLSIVTNQNLLTPAKKQDNMVCPIDVNAYCEDYQTSLHVSVKQRNHVIASSLLNSKADPNLPILPAPLTQGPYDNHQGREKQQQRREENSTALVESCMQRDLGMIELLLKYGARDDDCKALSVVSKDDIIVGKILSLKAHLDPENKVNITFMHENVLQRLKKPLLATSILPSASVTINWHNQKLDRISEQWLISAALKINPRLRLCPRNQHLSLHAITRLDLSGNSISRIPSVVFTLCSLKYLNCSSNKIQHLDFPEVITMPWLEECLLQENRFETIPPELFTCFPSLQILNLSKNSIQSVPSCMWTSPKLQELNLSLNLLTELPTLSSEMDISSQFDSLTYSITSSTFKQSPEDEEAQSPDFVVVDIDKNRKPFCRSKNESTPQNQQGPLMSHHALWRQNVKILSDSEFSDKALLSSESSSLLSLNLAHNSFHKIPKVLSCLGVNIQRLNLAYNNLKEMGHISDYPSTIRQIDLSKNRLEKWFFSPLEKSKSSTKSTCYPSATSFNLFSDGNTNEKCIHKKHHRLENLKTLLLSGNLLKVISIGPPSESTNNEADQSSANNDASNSDSLGSKTRIASRNLWFPNITMLDLSENKLTEVTPRVAELSNLSVLNLSGNPITDLPCEMGLLNRMWNLNTTNCNLQEPLKSMIESKRCKTMDIVGYLKSILEDAKAYARMKLMVVGVQGIGKTSLLSQLKHEGSSQKNVSQDHWAKRMNAANKVSNQKSGKTISTVGVDIGSWVLEYKSSGNHRTGNFGPVLMRTWDFAGQKEYYATHLYFLSRRSLYLVVWNICDGEKGLNEIVQWLINIQARAPNSQVIIVGTHYDLVSEKFPPGYLDYLQQKIRDRFICISDPEKRGLPKVIYSLEVSCKTRHNIKALCNLIYDTVFNIKTSHGKRLLEQKIPSKYIHLEEIVAYLATSRKSQGLDPVLTEQEFKAQVSSWLDKGFGLKFRDDAEIMQACSFLHENGVLLHYEDSTLRDLYFLDPQWLCDMLAHVVTVREINPFAKNGVMKVDDLQHLFKGQSSETRNYVLSLLSKFELAVPWSNVHLLIPSLLPTLDQMKMKEHEVRVRIPVRSRGWALKNRAHRISRRMSEDNIKAIQSSGNVSIPVSNSSFQFDTSSPIKSPLKLNINNNCCETSYGVNEDFFSIQRGKMLPLTRFLLLSYFPSGFWPRLISRILSDDRIVEIVRNYFNVPAPSEITQEMVKVLDMKAEWNLFASGMELHYGHLLVLQLREVTGFEPFTFMLRRDDGALCETDVTDNPSSDIYLRQETGEQVWDVVDLNDTGLLEFSFPALSIVVNSLVTPDSPDINSKPKIKSFTLEPSIESISKLLALIVDQVDTLLEDWYPSIGTRFVHTSEGKYLVTRLIPCPRCFPTHPQEGSDEQNNLEKSPQTPSSQQSKPDGLFRHLGFGLSKSPRMSSDSGVHSPSNTRVSSVDSNTGGENKEGSQENEPTVTLVKSRFGAGFDSPKFGNSGEYSGASTTNYSGLNFFLKGWSGVNAHKKNMTMYSWSVEYCILHSQRFSEAASQNMMKNGKKQNNASIDMDNLKVNCPKHGDIFLKDIAPDILFLDLNSRYLLNSCEIQRGTLLGRGAFGFVFGGKFVPKYETKPLEIAIKMFQPINPGEDSEAQAAFKVAKAKWLRSPAQSACRAYIAARGEVRVLYWVSHPNIVPFVGLCQSPLSIIMPKAPRGALDTVLSDYKRSGDKVHAETVKITVIQVGKALEYLHSHRIIYRDLKSENVLVWTYPLPFSPKEDRIKVDVKLADYGISRASFPTGSKGFGGTEGFMAPEIIRYNGEEEYKVDVFSFGMLLYEMISLKQPFDGCENVKESILEGLRPALTRRDCEMYPLYILDLMVNCWSHIAKDRPTASQIIAIAIGPEFTTLRDVVSLSNVTNVVAAIGLQYGEEKEVWTSCSTGGIYCLKLKSAIQFDSCHCFEFISGVVTAMCQIDDDAVWMGDTLGKIHILRISNYYKLAEMDLESQVGYCGAVVSIRHLEPVVAIAVSSGRLFLCDKTNGNPVSELGKSTVIHCLSSRSTADGMVELWTGGKSGQMTVFTIKGGIVMSQEEVINHYESIIEAVEVLLIESHASNNLMFSYVYPGSVIYGWDCNKRDMISRLDVGKLLPVRESMGDEELNSKPLQVTVLRSTLTEVYVGTNRGFIFLADIKNLRPITSFRPFNSDVRSFWIFREHSSSSDTLSSANDPTSTDIQQPLHSIPGSSNNKLEESLSTESNNSRGNSPTPSQQSDKLDGTHGSTSSLVVSNSQLVVGVGKGFSNLIEKNIDVITVETKQRRRAFALLWQISDSWNE